ncbi:MAG: gluconate 2-dehydrogenase subunit 3 family protein [Acidimicrobiia bacterium]|nr:gluconate 2-dehydrogenase subunit 3 family protein [Acidimicrobiia bacterium]
MPHLFFSDDEYAVIQEACERLIPGAREAAVADYVDGLLGAFAVDPPRIWAGGPFSGRHGGNNGFATFTALSPIDELAWRTRIEGSRGIPEREFNGPVVGLQERYRNGLVALGTDFATVDTDTQDARLRDNERFTELLYEHVCEGMCGAPEYGGNRGLKGWTSIGFEGDVQPRGYTDDEVSQP